MFRSAQRGSALQIPAVAVVAACTTIAVIGVPSSQPATGVSLDAATVTATTVRAAASAGAIGIKVPAGRDAFSKAVASRATASRGTGGSDGIRVEVPEGTPVHGDATVTVEKGEDFEIQPPECTVEPSGSNTVHVRCGTQVGDHRVEADTVLGIDP